MSEETMVIEPGRTSIVAKALKAKSRVMILKILYEEDMNITSLAERMGMSIAAVSEHIKILVEAGLTTIHYKSGMHGGVKKVCSTNTKNVVFNIR